MQAVILAAGSSTRTYPLTLTIPKPLLKVSNKTILEYNLEALKDLAEEIIIVVGYKKGMIKKFIKKNYPDLNIRFIEQREQLGTGHAVSLLKDKIKNKFILLMGDNIYSRKDVNKIAKHQYSILVKKVKNPELFGVVKEKNDILTDIIEKPKKFVSDIVSCALYSFDEKIFGLLEDIKKSERSEYELTDAIKKLSVKNDVYCVKSSSCFQISYPWDLLAADKEIRKGRNVIGKNSKIKGNIKNCSIGNNCLINGNIKNSIIMDTSVIDGNSIIEDSIIGRNVHFSGKIIAKNNIYSTVKNEKIKVDRLGAVIADNVKADNVVIDAGCKIWPNKKLRGKIRHDIH
ncbi:MAG: NTP transferase domain-containing protein [Nanoarchaeota archaeon]|nr:NTP transferase domain-containing protein [Nanoarchaeota archaeon]